MISPKIWSQPPSPLPHKARRVCFVSGLSDPTSSALSMDQLALLRSLPFEDSEIVTRNFPFTIDRRDVAREVSLIWASFNNGWQYWRLDSPRYCDLMARHWQNLLQHTDRLYLVSLSCGLEFIRAGIHSHADAARMHVVALGPVCRCLPECELTIIQGAQDWISRRFVPAANHRIEGLGHMGYISHPKVQEILCNVLANSISA
ncbi:MAG: hypothetical protein ACK5AC_04040 [Planctomycetota bacterium]